MELMARVREDREGRLSEGKGRLSEEYGRCPEENGRFPEGDGKDSEEDGGLRRKDESLRAKRHFFGGNGSFQEGREGVLRKTRDSGEEMILPRKFNLALRQG
ncbi:MAG: hypothetical protein LBT40_09820 [Deltaproteobacteria bacterium]|jgi:hypothetical protein|nr:hypothetical protein [Deltaproteobacteria bacterium]